MKVASIGLLMSLILCVSMVSCKQDKAATAESTVVTEVESKEEPQTAEAYYQRAKYYYEEKDYDNAIADLKKAVKFDSPRAAYYHLLSDCNLDYYRSKDALQNMEEAAKLFPDSTNTWLKLSETQLILKQYEPALLSVAQVMAIDPDNSEAHFMKGLIFREMGETNRAINAFQTATEINPELTEAWLFAARLFDEKKMDIAEDYYDGAINSDPDNVAAIHSKAFFLQNKGKDLEAIELYRRITLIDKGYMDAYMNTGILYMSMDSLGKAMEQFNIMSGIKPQNHLPYYYRGLIYNAQGNIAAARTELQNCLNLKSDFTKAKQALTNLSNS